MLARAVIVALVLVGAGAAVEVASRRQLAAPRLALATLPRAIGDWQGSDAVPLADGVVATLGVDDYVNRRYVRSGLPVAAYIGYYADQRSGDSIHSPRNCLPGTGWEPTASGVVQIPTADGRVIVNRYEIAKDGDRQVVLYWYQGRGRVVAGEYANKGWLILDAARAGRSDGGLVRLIAPVVTSPTDAVRELTSFAALLLPELSRYLP